MGEWEVAKLFCSSLGPHEECIETQVNADAVDATCMFNMLLLCKEFSSCVDASLVHAALGVRNGKFGHTSDLWLSDDEADEAIDQLVELLNYPGVGDPANNTPEGIARVEAAVTLIESDQIRTRDFGENPASLEERDSLKEEVERLEERVKEAERRFEVHSSGDGGVTAGQINAPVTIINNINNNF